MGVKNIDPVRFQDIFNLSDNRRVESFVERGREMGDSLPGQLLDERSAPGRTGRNLEAVPVQVPGQPHQGDLSAAQEGPVDHLQDLAFSQFAFLRWPFPRSGPISDLNRLFSSEVR